MLAAGRVKEAPFGPYSIDTGVVDSRVLCGGLNACPEKLPALPVIVGMGDRVKATCMIKGGPLIGHMTSFRHPHLYSSACTRSHELPLCVRDGVEICISPWAKRWELRVLCLCRET